MKVLQLVTCANNHFEWLGLVPSKYTLSIIVDGLEKRIYDFERRFKNLASAAVEEVIKQNKISVEKFHFEATLLPLDVKNNHLSFLKENLVKLSTASNLYQYFSHLNLYWDYFNYTLLQVIIDHYGSDDLKQKMKAYATDIEQFEKETTVAEFIPYCNAKRYPNFHSNSNEFTNLKSVINKPKSEYTLFEVEELRCCFCQEFNLPRFALIFSGLSEGSVVLIWSIPIELEKHLCEEVRKHQIKDINLRELVTYLSLGGKCVRANYN